MSDTSWNWDPNRDEYYYYSPVDQTYIYQNGLSIRMSSGDDYSPTNRFYTSYDRQSNYVSRAEHETPRTSMSRQGITAILQAGQSSDDSDDLDDSDGEISVPRLLRSSSLDLRSSNAPGGRKQTTQSDSQYVDERYSILGVSVLIFLVHYHHCLERSLLRLHRSRH
jgi:hypothetical protein